MSGENLIKILFVINPVAGGGLRQDWKKVIEEYFGQEGVRSEFFLLDGQTDGASLGDRIKKFEPSKVVAVGGDGTVSFVARQLLGSGISLGILPGGSANGMAKELGLPETINENLGVIARGNIKNADVIRVNNDHICLHLSDIGLNAKLIKYFEEGRWRGKLGYARVVLKTLLRKTVMNVHITINERQISHVAEMVVIANASKYGTGAVINPGGNLFDGHFEVVIMHKLALSELFKMWFRPRPFDPEKIKVFPATTLLIQTSRKAHFQIDGEYQGKVKKVEASVLSGQLKLITP